MSKLKKVNETNCYRVCRLLLDGGKQLLFHFLEQSIGSATIDAFLAANKTKLLNLKNGTRRVITKPQQDILYPPSGGTDMQHWDITLTSCIIKNICPMSTLQKQSVEKIRNLRNELYGHIGEFQMTKSEFSSAWTKVKQALEDGSKQLLRNSASFDIKSLMDGIEKEETVDVDELKLIFDTWRASDMAVWEVVQDNARKLDNIQSSIEQMKINRHNEEQSFIQRVYRGLVALLWTMIVYFWTFLGYPPIKEQVASSPSIQNTEQHMEPGLPREYRDLQSDLMKYYSTYLIKSPTHVQSAYKETDIGNLYAAPNLVQVDHTSITDNETNKKEISLEDLFHEDKDGCQQIYVSGDAGMGKTSFCKHIVASWCRALSQVQNTDKQDLGSNLKKFDFLFYISLRDARDQYEIRDMIVSQLLPETTSTETLLDELLQKYSRKCLIILDGLDEWTSPTLSSRVPGRRLRLNYTIVTLTRPWKLETTRLKEKDIDQKLEIHGVKDVDDFGERLVKIYNAQQSQNKKYIDFLDALFEQSLNNLMETPILFKQLICLWFNDKPFGNSKTSVYANMVDLLFELGERRENVQVLSIETYDKEEKFTMPNCFKELVRCQRYTPLLISLAHLAFNTLFHGGTEKQLVFDQSQIDFSEDDIDVCLSVGLLTKSIVPDTICDRKSFSFLHKTFHEFFAALHLSVRGSSISNIGTVIGSKFRSAEDLFDMADMFCFLSAMCPSIMPQCIVAATDNIKEILVYRGKRILTEEHEKMETFFYDKEEKEVIKVQTLILSCCRESSDNENGDVYLPIPDVVLNEYVTKDDVSLLEFCMQHYPSDLRSFNWLCYDPSNGVLPDFVSVQQLNNDCKNKPNKMKYKFKLSAFSELCVFKIEGKKDMSEVITWSLNEQQLTCLSFKHVCPSLVLSTIKQARMLKNLKLVSVSNEESMTDTPCPIKLDLSENVHLKSLTIKDMSFESVILNQDVSHVVINDIKMLTHDGICTLMSSLSTPQSLQYLELQSVRCKEHACATSCEYHLDLSRNNELRYLDLSHMSPGSVTLNQNVSEVVMKDIKTFTHDGICAFMSSISTAQSLQSLLLISVTCKEHVSWTGCDYHIDLSSNNELRYLDLSHMSPGSVTLNHNVSKVVMTNINMFTHDGIRALMSSISTAQSLQSLQLQSVTSTEHASGTGCDYHINLSRNNNLRDLDLSDMSPESVTLYQNVSEVVITHIKLSTHDGIHDFMSSISTAQSLQSLQLVSVTCTEHASGTGCEYHIDLSTNNKLRSLYLSNMSPRSVTLNQNVTRVSMNRINMFTHDGICAFMSSISTALSLQSLQLESVTCTEHASGTGCDYHIDLSSNSNLRDLNLINMSPGSVTLNHNVSDVVITDIKMLTHDGICAFMSSISTAQSLQSLILESVTCTEHASGTGCDYHIDLSSNNELRSLDLRNMAPGSVSLNHNVSDVVMTDIKMLTRDGICAFMSSISTAKSLQSLKLKSVTCTEHASGTGCEYHINLSSNSNLKSLYLSNMSPGSVTMNHNVSEVVMNHIKISAHDGICDFMSSMSTAKSLHSLTLGSVTCTDASGTGCEYHINLSSNNNLRSLYLSNMSPGSVTLNQNVTRVSMNNIKMFTHDGICAFMSSISTAKSLQSLQLQSVTCTEHASGAGCEYHIDLSSNNELRSLNLSHMSPGSVTLNHNVSEVFMTNIKMFTYDVICAFMSSISTAQSLQSLNLVSVTCTEHASGTGCDYHIDLSRNNNLRSLYLINMSPGSVTLNQNVTRVSMNNIKMFTHDEICAFMSSISTAQSLYSLILQSLSCTEHASGTGCEYHIDLSSNNELRYLSLSHMSPGSVTLNQNVTRVIITDIKMFTHDGICAFMSSISTAQSLYSLILQSLTCTEHASRTGCEYHIDLSSNNELRDLYLSNMSPGSVTLNQNIYNLHMSDINILTHDGVCDFKTSMSNAKSIYVIDLWSVKCTEHGTTCEYCKDDISFPCLVLTSSESNQPYMRNKLKRIYILKHKTMYSFL